MQFKKRTPKRLSLDITPLVDIIFLLLIFFMVSTTFITSPGIHVNLPKASSTSKTEKPESLEIVITEENKVYLNGRSIKNEQIKSLLAAAQKTNRAKTLIIKADGNVKHEEVVFVMDAAKQVGLHKLSIAIQPKQDK